MKITMKLAALALACMAFLAGCNTVAGAGKDLRKVGEKIEGAAR